MKTLVGTEPAMRMRSGLILNRVWLIYYNLCLMSRGKHLSYHVINVLARVAIVRQQKDIRVSQSLSV